MPKAIVCPGGTVVSDGEAYMSYSVSVIRTPAPFGYSSNYQVNDGISLAANLTAWKNKIIAEVGNVGVVLVGADVIVFGSPS